MIRLRPAEPQDEWTAWQLRREIQSDLLREEHVNWWNEVWEHRFIAYDGPAFVGIIRVTPILNRPDVPSGAGIVHLQVTRKEQGKGLGTQMLKVIQRIAPTLGLTGLQANVCAGNLASQKAFASAGFRPTQFELHLQGETRETPA